MPTHFRENMVKKKEKYCKAEEINLFQVCKNNKHSFIFMIFIAKLCLKLDLKRKSSSQKVEFVFHPHHIYVVR